MQAAESTKSAKKRRLSEPDAEIIEDEMEDHAEARKPKTTVKVYVVKKMRYLGRLPREHIGHPLGPTDKFIVLPKRFASVCEWGDLFMSEEEEEEEGALPSDVAIQTWSVLVFLAADDRLMAKCERSLSPTFHYTHAEHLVRHAALYLRHGPNRVAKPAPTHFSMDSLKRAVTHKLLDDMVGYDILEAVAYSICEIGKSRHRHHQNMCHLDTIDSWIEDSFLEQIRARFPETFDVVLPHLRSDSVLAGGSVVDILMPESKRPSAQGSDLDVFALNSNFRDYVRIVTALAEAMGVDHVEYKPTCAKLRGKHDVQVVLTHCKTAQELITSFDMAHTAAAFWPRPNTILTTWGCIYATHRMLTWRTTKAPFAEHRIAKARRKGFKIAGVDAEEEWGLVKTAGDNLMPGGVCPDYFDNVGVSERLSLDDLKTLASRVLPYLSKPL